ncbi:uncharacterized protein LOC129763523 [Toxorhynchites rutilus septentrionalis]|uniref:uncharacterized protein LOC129763523 n=1 Tax=Toxorhynchites rutilus septentrionalis TaxID=329112 RepID=UPI0024786B0C|nr:uncharacterized protein LOC129763523 [Toxorhynchites rutilus septentrionalis]
MENTFDVIDLCDIKSIKSEDSSETIPFDESKAKYKQENIDSFEYTKQWVDSQRLNVDSCSAVHDREQGLSNTVAPPTPITTVAASTAFRPERRPIPVPLEFTDLVNKECVIKLINSLMTYAIHKSAEVEMRRKIISIAPDIYSQISYHTSVGFQFIHEKCVELFHQALLEFTEIFLCFAVPMRDLVISWMYNMIEDMCGANFVDGKFLRHERYIEKLILDFTNARKQTPNSDNVFFNLYQKLSAPISAQSGAMKSLSNNEKPKRQRKARVKEA